MSLEAGNEDGVSWTDQSLTIAVPRDDLNVPSENTSLHLDEVQTPVKDVDELSSVKRFSNVNLIRDTHPFSVGNTPSKFYSRPSDPVMDVNKKFSLVHENCRRISTYI